MSERFLSRLFATLAIVTTGPSAGPNALYGRIESLPVGLGKVNATASRTSCNNITAPWRSGGCPVQAPLGRAFPRSRARRQTIHRREEPLQLSRIQFAVGSHARTEIKPERPNLVDCLAYILRRKPSCEEHRDTDAFPDGAAEGPIVSSASAAQFLDWELLVARIEQDSIHMRRDSLGLFDRLWPGHVDDLHD